MVFARWRNRRANREVIERIHGQVVDAARRPALYQRLGVPDTLDGRFEMTTLHAGLTLRRLLALGPLGAEIAQELADRTFRAFDDALREMSISDVGVARRMRNFASAFYGRLNAYDEALKSQEADALAKALARNVFAEAELERSPKAPALATYVRSVAAALDRAPLEAFRGGAFVFPPAPTEEPS